MVLKWRAIVDLLTRILRSDCLHISWLIGVTIKPDLVMPNVAGKGKNGAIVRCYSRSIIIYKCMHMIAFSYLKLSPFKPSQVVHLSDDERKGGRLSILHLSNIYASQRNISIRWFFSAGYRGLELHTSFVMREMDITRAGDISTTKT